MAGCSALAAAFGRVGISAADEPKPSYELPKAADFTLVKIAGKPRERGKQYGSQFKDAIAAFLDKEIYQPCTRKYATRDALLRYAGACGKAVKEYAPAILEEYEGIAEGTGLKLEEVLLLSLHEETAGHQDKKLPVIEHCTALAAAPPFTRDGNTYVGQTWDWMKSVYGLSSMLLWQRPEGPSVLAYVYPGLWIGAGLNSAGLGLCWTSAFEKKVKEPRVGIPTYVLITQMLYQETLADALEEARRAKHAGWFAFVLSDAKGNIAGVDGTPEKLAIEKPSGYTARASYACREIIGEEKVHVRCQRMLDLLAGAKGKLDQAALQGFFADHWFGDPKVPTSTICFHPTPKGGGFTLDTMLFNCTRKEVHIKRGPACCANPWQKFTFPA
jgi:isopenicillin-N N-acyltransferase-like protein